MQNIGIHIFTVCDLQNYTLCHLVTIYLGNQLQIQHKNFWADMIFSHTLKTTFVSCICYLPDYHYHVISKLFYLAETICEVILIVSNERVDSITKKPPSCTFASASKISLQCTCSRVLDTYNICIVCPHTFEESLKIWLVFHSLSSPKDS